MGHRLCTLLIAMALMPPLLARVWFDKSNPPSTKFGEQSPPVCSVVPTYKEAYTTRSWICKMKTRKNESSAYSDLWAAAIILHVIRGRCIVPSLGS
jgi:hypothetical protein